MNINNLRYKPANYNFVFWSNQMKKTKENKFFKKNFEKKLKEGCNTKDIRENICDRIFEILVRKKSVINKINKQELKQNLYNFRGKAIKDYVDYISNITMISESKEIELYLDIIKYIDLSISLDKYNYFC